MKFLLFNLLFCFVSSFTPSKLRNHHVHTSWQNDYSREKISLEIATDRIVSIRPESNFENSILDFDESTGCLKLGDETDSDDILVKGLDSSIWTASRPLNGDTSSLFLHTSHPEESSEHQTVLGDLIACRRLLACSSMYTITTRKIVLSWLLCLTPSELTCIFLCFSNF